MSRQQVAVDVAEHLDGCRAALAARQNQEPPVADPALGEDFDDSSDAIAAEVIYLLWDRLT